MKLSKQILEAIDRALKISLDDFEDTEIQTQKSSTLTDTNSTKLILDQQLEKDMKPVLLDLNGRNYSSKFRINMNMKTWFTCVTDEVFRSVVDYGIQTLRAVRGKRYAEDIYYVSLYFTDGFLSIKISLSPHGRNKFTHFYAYFADEPITSFDARCAAYKFQTELFENYYKEQLKYFEEHPEEIKRQLPNDFWISHSRKEAAERMLRFFKFHINRIVKQ